MFNVIKCQEILAERKMTQKELAERAGTTELNVKLWINGEVEPQLRSIGKLAAGLDVKPRELIVHVPYEDRIESNLDTIEQLIQRVSNAPDEETTGLAAMKLDSISQALGRIYAKIDKKPAVEVEEADDAEEDTETEVQVPG